MRQKGPRKPLGKIIKRSAVQRLRIVGTKKFESARRSARRSVQTQLADGKAEPSGGEAMVGFLSLTFLIEICAAN